MKPIDATSATPYPWVTAMLDRLGFLDAMDYLGPVPAKDWPEVHQGEAV